MLNLLIIEDDTITGKLIEKYARDWGYRVYTAKTGQSGWSILRRRKINIVILDWELPDMTGLELAEKIQKLRGNEYIYLIFVTSKSDHASVLRGFETGADDYISKPFNVLELKARIRTGARIIKLERGLRRSHKKLEKMAMHDGLTGLLNRRATLQSVKSEYLRSGRDGKPLGFISIDIDHFKSINDTYGHHVGDQVLKQVTEMISGNLRQYDEFGRIGGEEFLIILPDCSPDILERIADRLRERIARRSITVDGNKLKVTISMGMTVHDPEDNVPVDVILKRIDTALYQAKTDGRNQGIYIDAVQDKPVTGGKYEKNGYAIS